MWCDTVGWDSPTGSIRSHTHASWPGWAAIIDTSRTRVGSLSALKIRARRSASSGSSTPSVSGAQQAPVTSVSGSGVAMGRSSHTH